LAFPDERMVVEPGVGILLLLFAARREQETEGQGQVQRHPRDLLQRRGVHQFHLVGEMWSIQVCSSRSMCSTMKPSRRHPLAVRRAVIGETLDAQRTSKAWLLAPLMTKCASPGSMTWYSALLAST